MYSLTPEKFEFYDWELVAIADDKKCQLIRRMEKQPVHQPIWCTPETTHGCAEPEWMDADCINPGVPMTCPFRQRHALPGTDYEIEQIIPRRVQSIDSSEALIEGVSKHPFWQPNELNGRAFEEKWWDDFHFWTHYPQLVYRRIYKSIHGVGSWERNEWVWQVIFRIPGGERERFEKWQKEDPPMNKLLTWYHRWPGPYATWWLAYTGLRMHAVAVLNQHFGGGWTVRLRDGFTGAIIIRCHDLREACDCARRWAEYRGFTVAERFPEGGAA